MMLNYNVRFMLLVCKHEHLKARCVEAADAQALIDPMLHEVEPCHEYTLQL